MLLQGIMRHDGTVVDYSLLGITLIIEDRQVVSRTQAGTQVRDKLALFE